MAAPGLTGKHAERASAGEHDLLADGRVYAAAVHATAVRDPAVFTKNRNRLLEGDVAREFLGEVVKQAQAKGLTSDEHFTVDGTLIEAWASLKSFRRRDEDQQPRDDPGNPTVNFRGENR